MAPTAARLQWLTMALLGVALVGLAPDQLVSALLAGLWVLTILKLREARRLGERRLVGLLQLLLAGLLAGLRPELGPSLLQALASLCALAGLLSLELGAGLGLRQLLRRSGQMVMAALPMALVLFLLVPRLGPFRVLPEGHNQGAITGLSPTLDPGAIAALAVNQATAARVVFLRGAPPAPGRRYWRVLVHDRFDGRRWSTQTPPAGSSPPIAAPAGSGLPLPAAAEDRQLWLDEPSGLKAVPWSGSGRPLSNDLRLTRQGELQHRGPASQRRLYAVSDDGGQSPWQRQAPQPLDLALPLGRNPRLEDLAAQWARRGPAPLRLALAEQWFRSQAFRYTLKPGQLPARAPLDAFLFERRQGFCGHYASAFTALMRAAGLPARVVSGYRGGEWVQPLGGSGYLELRQADAHAWSEVWIDGEGWRRVDPTAWIPGGAALPDSRRYGRGFSDDAFQWLQRQLWGIDLAWSRLWLGFDRDSQNDLLRRLLGDRLQWLGPLVLVALTGCLGAAVAVLGWWQRRGGSDPWRCELDGLLAVLAGRGMVPEAGETLPRFAARLEQHWPQLAPDLQAFVALYQQRRFGPEPQAGSRGPGGLSTAQTTAQETAKPTPNRAANRAGLGQLRRGRRRLARQLRRLSS